LKSVLELVSFTDFFLAQSKKETPQRTKEAAARALQQLLRRDKLYCSAGIAPDDFISNKYILINNYFLLFINKFCMFVF
jgi:hypothetical protein